ncbi:MAG: DUF4870 domain-containing protein [Nodosilinea sp.]
MHQLDSDPESRMWAMLAHLSALLGAFVLPLVGGIVAPLLIWLIKREEMSFVDDQAKEALNFNISVAIYGTVVGALTTISALLVVVLVGIPLLLVLGLASLALAAFWFVLSIMAAVKANEGVAYRYPFTLRLVK